MKYVRLGNTGLKVSSLCLGTMTFGDGADEVECGKIYAACRDHGVNFFDCANVYANGDSERILGKLVQGQRNEVVITSKAYYPTSDDVNGRGLSRHHLTKALDRSLSNLNTDYIDIYYLHAFDEETPLEETLTTLNDFVRRGKILYIGVSNFSAWQVMKAISVAELSQYAPIACIQPMYNLLKRQCESELLPMAESEQLGVVSYSPLGGGYLTGKYFQSETAKGRFDSSEMYQRRYADESYRTTIGKFLTFADEINIHPIALAVAWVMSHPAITAPIIGARSAQQLRPSLKGLDVQLTEETRSMISRMSAAPPLPSDREEERT